LIARFLCTGPRSFSTGQFIIWMQRAVAQVTAAGSTLDPLLQRAPPEALARQRLRWLQRKKLVTGDDTLWQNAWPSDAGPGWHSPAAIVRYLANSLDDILSLAVAERGP
ncbi:MAG TPA: hypothetical protein VFF72_08660, partial [Caldimonas sp.]|nr:hypothetical protein [Caldimonas sp.]